MDSAAVQHDFFDPLEPSDPDEITTEAHRRPVDGSRRCSAVCALSDLTFGLVMTHWAATRSILDVFGSVVSPLADGLAVSLTIFAAAVGAALTTAFSHIGGCRRMLLTGAVFVAVALLVSGATTDLETLITCRTGMGLGVGMIVAAAPGYTRGAVDVTRPALFWPAMGVLLANSVGWIASMVDGWRFAHLSATLIPAALIIIAAPLHAPLPPPLPPCPPPLLELVLTQPRSFMAMVGSAIGQQLTGAQLTLLFGPSLLGMAGLSRAALPVCLLMSAVVVFFSRQPRRPRLGLAIVIISDALVSLGFTGLHLARTIDAIHGIDVIATAAIVTGIILLVAGSLLGPARPDPAPRQRYLWSLAGVAAAGFHPVCSVGPGWLFAGLSGVGVIAYLSTWRPMKRTRGAV